MSVYGNRSLSIQIIPVKACRSARYLQVRCDARVRKKVEMVRKYMRRIENLIKNRSSEIKD